MINLLPPQIKEDMLYARRNTILIKWLLASAVSIVGIAVIVIAGTIYISQMTKTYAAEVEDSKQQLQAQQLDETQKKVQEMSGSMKLVVQVLSRQVLFSSLLQQIGSAIPSGAVLTGLSINTLEGGIDLDAAAKDYETASQVQVNLQDPANQIFEKADIVSIDCGRGATSTNPLDVQYPCKVTLRALFAKDNPFMLIKPTGAPQ
jgi:Tfp pilus assembly protein PilN